MCFPTSFSPKLHQRSLLPQVLRESVMAVEVDKIDWMRQFHEEPSHQVEELAGRTPLHGKIDV